MAAIQHKPMIDTIENNK